MKIKQCILMLFLISSPAFLFGHEAPKEESPLEQISSKAPFRKVKKWQEEEENKERSADSLSTTEMDEAPSPVEYDEEPMQKAPEE